MEYSHENYEYTYDEGVQDSDEITNGLFYESHISMRTPRQNSSALSDSVFTSHGRKSKKTSPGSAPGGFQNHSSTAETSPSSTVQTTPQSEPPTIQRPPEKKLSEKKPAAEGKRSKASSMSNPAFRPAKSISLSSGTVLSSRPHVKTDYMAMLSFLENKGTRRNGDRNKDDERDTQASLISSIVDEMHDTVQSVDHPKSKKKPPLRKCSPLRVSNYLPAPLDIDDTPLTQNTPLTHMPYAQEITDYDFGKGVLDFNTPTFDPQKPTTNEVQELRELINHLSWAGESLKEVQKRYFDKQMKAMRRGWNELTADKEEFERKKAEENAKIASIRNSLTEEKKQRKSSLKSDEETIKTLETDVKKLKESEAKQSRLISELRAKINHLEGEKKANDENNRMQLKKLKDQQETLTKTQVENAGLRTQNKLLKEKASTSDNSLPTLQRSNSASQFLNLNTSNDSARQKQPPRNKVSAMSKTVRWSSPLTQSPEFGSNFAIPENSAMSNSDMVSTGEVTERRVQHTTKNASFLSTELNCGCLLSEYNNGNFQWMSKVGESQQLQVEYRASDEVFNVTTLTGHRLCFSKTCQLDIYWKNSDRTQILPNGNRVEMYASNGLAENKYEKFENGKRIQWEDFQEKEVFDQDPNEPMSHRPDMSSRVCILQAPISQQMTVETTRIETENDFTLSRVFDGFARIKFDKIELSICPSDGTFIAKHVTKTKEGKSKKLCFGNKSCSHISMNVS
ncbi:hypothetical protein Ddc_02120 [Ditylenchus destructor]|nr:hypothetical protein Ddc_02120 [Ditylenchus destructor]